MSHNESEQDNLKPIALMSSYGADGYVQRVEVSITYPKQMLIVTHKAWVNDGSKTTDQITTEAVAFAKKHNVARIEMVDSLLPISEVTTGKCPHCGGDGVRVPWI